MPEQRQTILNPAPETGAAKGSRKDVNLRSAFSSSPIYKNELNDEERKETYNDEALNGTVVGGHGINTFDRDFVDSPDLENVDIAAHNLPSPFMPNPTSPGPGSVNASDKPAFTGDVPDPALNVEFGAGLGGTVSPQQTSEQISKQDTLSGYISGKSYAGSDGAS